jgi:nucleoside-diphosphate-sugar epimerase
MQNGYKKKVLILGGTGFIGINLSLFLLKRKYNITVVSKNKPKKINKIKNIKYISLNLNNHKRVKEVIKDEYHYVINSSGYVDHDNYKKNGKNILRSHFLDILNLIEIFIGSKKLIKFIQIGSGDEYGENKSPMKEELREIPKSPYSYSKLALTKFLQMLNTNEKFPATVIRVFLAYGPYQEPNRLIPFIVKSCLSDKTFSVSPGIQIRDFCYIDDICDAILKIMRKKNQSFQIYNVGSGKKIKVRDLIKEIVSIIGKGNPLFGKIKMRKQETKILYPDLNKIKIELKWYSKTTLNLGLRKTINFIKKNN